MNELLTEDYSGREPLSLYKRAFASLLDKIFILILFLILSLLIFGLYVAPGDLGTYSVVLEMTPKRYDFMPKGSLMYNVDIAYTILFIVTNILYYSTELLFKASLGKRILGGVYVDLDGDKICLYKVVSRCFILALMMVGAVVIHFVFGVTYWTVIVLFFLINDLPVLFTKRHQSLVDIVSETCLVKRKPEKYKIE